MELLELLGHPVFGEELCKTLTFEDAVRIQHSLGKEKKFPCTIQVTDKKGLTLTFKEINPETIRIYRLIKGKDVFMLFVNAAIRNRLEIVQSLLNVGFDINYVGYNETTALLETIYFGNKEGTLFLIQNGANVNTVNKSRRSPLLGAIIYDDAEITKLLIDNGANVNEADKNGLTPLHAATDQQNEQIIRMLIKHGANVNTVDHNGRTPLMLARSPEIVGLLKEYGARE